MQQHFVDALGNAQGRSEFIIVAVIDIRGFSRFSTRHESPNIAMFIKRFYLRLIKDYFPGATFVKPTGDGLLMTFPYDENSLQDVAKQVIEACLRVLVDFPTLCKDDPMINFKTPDAVGIGIARGTACCLFSGEETLDYSGHLLNLASRLNDLARPSGIVIDGAFLGSIIPESCRNDFKTQPVFVRSIAEDKPITVFYLGNRVKIPGSALVPLTDENWRSVSREFSFAELNRVTDKFRILLPTRARAAEDVRVTLTYPKKGLKGLVNTLAFKAYEYSIEALQDVVTLSIQKAKEIVNAGQMSQRAKMSFRIDYIPKPLARS